MAPLDVFTAIPAWTAFLIWVAGSLVIGHLLHWRKPDYEPRCVCGYRITGLPDGCCPECGRAGQIRPIRFPPESMFVVEACGVLAMTSVVLVSAYGLGSWRDAGFMSLTAMFALAPGYGVARMLWPLDPSQSFRRAIAFTCLAVPTFLSCVYFFGFGASDGFASDAQAGLFVFAAPIWINMVSVPFVLPIALWIKYSRFFHKPH